jgi:circadian clock protein KaiC
MTSLTPVVTDLQPDLSTGVVGLDEILMGGLTPRRLYLLEGAPGSGKTTLALNFLLAGAARAERVLYVTLSETATELRAVAASHGWDLGGIEVFDLGSASDVLSQEREQTLLHPWEVELGEVVKLITDEVERVNPRRVVFDSLSELRLLAQDPLRYRRQVLSLKQYFAGRNITVVLVDDLTASTGSRDTHLHSLCHAVITLERLTLDFGATRRRLLVQKYRGVAYRGGYHDFVIRTGGLDVFPRLVASEHDTAFVGEPTPSGVVDLDSLLNGGPLRGTTTLISGPAGAGKTTLALQYVVAACRRGENATIYEFDERIGTLLLRSRSMGMDLQPHIDSGVLRLQQVDPAELSPGEFATMVRRDVADRDCRMIMVDSISGYLTAMPQEQQLMLQMHEMLSYLNRSGVVTFLINPQQSLLGSMQMGGINVSYIADTVLMLRFFEADGRISKALSVLKNRAGPHEDTIRELRIDCGGIRVGPPLTQFRGVLTGTPEYVGEQGALMEDRGDAC